MKSTSKIAILLVLGLLLAACAAGTATEPTAGPALSADYDGALPVEMQLMLGTFKLEGTDQAVDATEAGNLIPLWEALRSLSSSDTAAPEEIQAVIDQITETMSADQITAIAAFQLSQQDVGGVIQDLGLSPFGSQSANGSDGSSQQQDGGTFTFRQGEAGGQGGDFAGGPPGGGNGPPDGGFAFRQGGAGGDGPFQGGNGNLDPSQIATLQAGRAGSTGFTNRAGLFLIDPLIELLQTRAGSQS